MVGSATVKLPIFFIWQNTNKKNQTQHLYFDNAFHYEKIEQKIIKLLFISNWWYKREKDMSKKCSSPERYIVEGKENKLMMTYKIQGPVRQIHKRK